MKLKSLLFGVLVTTFALNANVAQAAAKEGDICGTTSYLTLSTTFKCANLFPDNKNLSIADIYQRGYRVVSVSTNSQGYTTIIIEKQG